MTPLCLDLSRLVSRVGQGRWTGIDRVEAAWLDRLCRGDLTANGLVKMRHGYGLLDLAGLQALAGRFHGRVPWGAPDLTSRMDLTLSSQMRSVEADLRRLCASTVSRTRLPRLLKKLPQKTTYLNVGHSNLSVRVLQSFHKANCSIAVLIHDLIPITHPQFQRPGTPAKFKTRLRRVGAYADLAIYNSTHTRTRAEARFFKWGNLPEGVVAHLGLSPLPPARPEQELIDGDIPYFIILGTIEPRKNHLLLLDLWEKLGRDAPHLLIIGRRGWENEEVFKILDSSPMMGDTVHEYSDLNDATITLLLRHARGLLFPSYAEGYGLPALEAARLGTPVVTTPLPAFKELLDDYPIYAAQGDLYTWAKAIKQLVEVKDSPEQRTARALPAPDWETHFNLVLSRL